ncbi:MAG: GTP cyclohydrolase I FolE [Chloroflexi bacterium]|nr:GTP cyclohydrolase I FolE [Chloroflexota bacterium]
MNVIQEQRIQEAISSLLEAIGEDPRRQGLQQTPERVARMYQELFSGIGVDPGEAIDTVFEAENQDPVVLRDIPFHSICEHHLLPFFGMAHLAYIPNGKIAGLSKLARSLEVATRRLQVQERLTAQVADAIAQALNPSGVAVELEAEHLCMSMRGIQKPGNRVITTAVRGPFANGGLGREGLLALLKRR